MDLIIPVAFCVALLIIISIRGSQTKKYGTPSVTNNGEDVKSKGEKQIADYLNQAGIKYKYEKKFITKNCKTIHPDFYLPKYDVFVEYWGLVDADNSRIKNNYVKSMKWKMAQYHSKNQKFISIYPKNLNNLDWVFRTKFENITGIQLLDN